MKAGTVSAPRGVGGPPAQLHRAWPSCRAGFSRAFLATKCIATIRLAPSINAGHDAGDEKSAHRRVGEVDPWMMEPMPGGMIGVITCRRPSPPRRRAARTRAPDHLGAQHLRLHRRVGVGGGGLEPPISVASSTLVCARPPGQVAGQALGEAQEARGDAGMGS